MGFGLAIAALLVAMAGLAVAVGVSLGRDGDRQDERVYRASVDEGMNQLDERLRKVEPDGEA
jgi:hypothetical protein